MGVDIRSRMAERLTCAGAEAWVCTGAPAGYAVAGPAPTATVTPADAAAVAATLATAAAEGWGVVPRGAGTQDAWGGCATGRPLLVLDTSRLRGVVAHTPGDLTARVLPGTTLAELNAYLRPHGQRLPLDPPHAALATIGGVVAGDAWGPGRAQYGAARDVVLGLAVVDGRGNPFRTGGHVVKNVSGLDVGKLLIGSFGTLGVLCEVTLKLRPLSAAAATWAVSFGPTHGSTHGSTLAPPPGTARAPAQAAGVLAEPAAWEAAVAVADGPFQPVGVALVAESGAATLVVRLEGGRAEVADQRTGLQARLGALGRTLDPEAAARAWAGAREPAGDAAAGLLLRCEVPEGRLPELAREVVGGVAGGPAPTRLTAWCGLGTLWCAWAGDAVPGPWALGAVRGVRAAAERLGGRAVVAACPPAVHDQAEVFGDPGPLLPAFRAIKARFDPERVLAPGRFVGAL